MKKLTPSQKRMLDFIRRHYYAGWTSIGHDQRKPALKLESLGFIEISKHPKKGRYSPTWQVHLRYD